MSVDDGSEEPGRCPGEGERHVQLEGDVEIALAGDVRRIIEHVLRTEESALAGACRIDRDGTAAARLLAMLLIAEEYGHDVESSLRRLAANSAPRWGGRGRR